MQKQDAVAVFDAAVSSLVICGGAGIGTQEPGCSQRPDDNTGQQFCPAFFDSPAGENTGKPFYIIAIVLHRAFSIAHAKRKSYRKVMRTHFSGHRRVSYMFERRGGVGIGGATMTLSMPAAAAA